MAIANVYKATKFATPKEMAKLAAPILAMIVALIVDTAFPTIYPQGYQSTVYPWLLRIFTIAYVALAAASCWLPKLRKHVIHFWGLFIVLFLLLAFYEWETLKTGAFELPYCPSVDAILASVTRGGGIFFSHLGSSLLLMLQGLAVGVVAGLIYGMLMGYSRFFNYWLNPFIKLIGPVPSTAWMAIAMVLSPSSHVAAVFLVALTVCSPFR